MGHQVVGHDPGLHAVDADAEGSELLGGVADQLVDGTLRRPVGPQPPVREVPGPGRHPDDGAATGRRHRPGPLLDADGRAQGVQLQGRSHGLDVGVEERAHVQRAPGVGHEDVEPARRASFGRRADGRLHLVFDGDVGDDPPRADADVLHRRLELRLRPSADRDHGAVGRQPRRGAEADAAAAAGDQRVAPFDRHGCSSVRDAPMVARAPPGGRRRYVVASLASASSRAASASSSFLSTLSARLAGIQLLAELLEVLAAHARGGVAGDRPEQGAAPRRGRQQPTPDGGRREEGISCFLTILTLPSARRSITAAS
jgi:hypothetical protein